MDDTVYKFVRLDALIYTGITFITENYKRRGHRHEEYYFTNSAILVISVEKFAGVVGIFGTFCAPTEHTLPIGAFLDFYDPVILYTSESVDISDAQCLGKYRGCHSSLYYDDKSSGMPPAFLHMLHRVDYV